MRNKDNNTSPKEKKIGRDSLKSNARRLYAYITPYRVQFFAGLFVLLISRIIMMAFPYLAGLMIDVAQGESAHNIDLNTLGLVLIGVLLLQGIISYGRVILFAIVSENALANLRADVYQNLLRLRLAFFEENKVGALISRVTGDIEKLYSVLSVTLAEFIGQIVVLLSGVIFLLLTTPKLTGIMLATFPLIVLGAYFFGRYIRKLSKKRQGQLAETNDLLSESIGGIQVVKAFTMEGREFSRYRESLREMVAISMKYARGRGLFSVFIITLLFGALFFIIWQAALMVSTGSITAGELVSFVSYTALIGGSIASISNFYTQLVGAVGATERVVEILDEPRENPDGKPSTDTPLKAGKIQFRTLNFSYPTAVENAVLRDVNLSIEPGERVALVGPSGAGKSTLLKVLLRFYETDSGEILMGGQNVRNFPLMAYRQLFAYVPQETILFGGSIRENIQYGRPDAGEEEIRRAAEQAYALGFIEDAPNGMDTVIGERGMKLSGGQRQRVAIARAILRDPKILLLDEATSSLDADSEKKVQMALDNLMKGRTSLVIAHRLATVISSDKILVMDKGRIIEEGTHEELIRKSNGMYQALASLQFQKNTYA